MIDDAAVLGSNPFVHARRTPPPDASVPRGVGTPTNEYVPLPNHPRIFTPFGPAAPCVPSPSTPPRKSPTNIGGAPVTSIDGTELPTGRPVGSELAARYLKAAGAAGRP